MRFLSKYKAAIFGLGVILLAAATLPGCKKFLDRLPLGQYGTTNYPYPLGGGPYDQYVYAAYSELRAYDVSTYAFIGAVSIRSDDADKGSSEFDGAGYGMVAADNFTMNAYTLFPNDLWIGYYTLIADCNTVLQVVGKDSSATSTPAEKTLAIAEAKFIRGYAYFTMERLFGNIPIVDTVLSVAQSNVPQSTPAEVYSFIEQDLQYAAVNLPAVWDPKFIGRATSGAANGLLAKAYLYEQKWDQAMSTAGLVINSGVYDLSTPYNVIFTKPGENSKESVFEIQCYDDATQALLGSPYGCQYASIQGVRGVGTQDLGWGFNDPSANLEAAYEAGDPRKASTILYCPSPFPTQYGETFPIEPDPKYNMKVYTDPAIRAAVGGLEGQHGWWTNVRILRYADVVLMYAEAANELGQTSEALEKLEWVRARARNGNNSILPPVTTTDQTQLRLAIQHERRIELAMEHERFFDLVRWGIAAQVFHSEGISGYTTGRDEWLPIPQNQIDLSKGVLHQNPGY
jgi:hypothetical protein